MNPAVRVVPDVATFAVDDGFWYSIPGHLALELDVGSIVRVPLSGRRVRGWVVERVDDRDGELKEVAGISGFGPVFDEDMLKSLVWAARHYVAPVSALLSRATPPNLPRSVPDPVKVPTAGTNLHALSAVAARSATGARSPVVAVVDSWHRLDWLQALGPVLEAGRSVSVIAASVAEVHQIHTAAMAIWGSIAVAVGGEDDASDTRAWETAQSPPRVVIGTPKTATWLVGSLGLAIVLEEGRRAMKDRQTPTIHVRDVMRTRSRLESFNVAFLGPTPSVELLSAGAELISPGNRAWPLVEVVDRSEDGPGSGFLSSRTVAAMAATAKEGRRVFVYTQRRVGLASTRCTKCRTLRACSNCGLRLGRVERCPRCETPSGPCSRCGGEEFEEMGTVPERLVSEINQRVGRRAATVHPGRAAITVGTERDLAGLPELSLAVAADVDGMLLGSGYRTSEEALRQLARLASVVAPGRGSRLMLQTSHPDSPLITTMRRGDPIPYLERVLIERAREGSPPASEMLAVEIRGDVPATASQDLAGLDERALVMGPMTVENGMRWLLTGTLGKARIDLRKVVGRWRDNGATVRVDADPIDI